MRKTYLFTICLLVFVACNTKRTMVDDLNESVARAGQLEIDTKTFDKQGRNLVYLLDPSCSACIGNYMYFLESLNYKVCNYDSLFTIVLNSNYLMNVEYYLNKHNTYRPETEKYIIDNDGELTDYYYSFSGNDNILLVDSGKLTFCTTTYEYNFEKDVGLVSRNKR